MSPKFSINNSNNNQRRRDFSTLHSSARRDKEKEAMLQKAIRELESEVKRLKEENANLRDHSKMILDDIPTENKFLSTDVHAFYQGKL